MIEYPGFFQRLQKIRSPKLLPDFDRFCCSTEQDYQPAENATSTGITSAQLRAKAELMLVTATARSSGVNDGKAFVETSADGSRASSSFHLSGNLTNAALNPARSSDPDPCVTAKSAYTGDISGHQIDDQLCTPGDDVPQGYDRFAGNEGAAYGVDTRYSSIDIPYGGCRRPQNDPSHSSNYYKQYDDSLGHSVPSPTRVDECSQFFEGDPSFVQQSYGQPTQLTTHFEQPQLYETEYRLEKFDGPRGSTHNRNVNTGVGNSRNSYENNISRSVNIQSGNRRSQNGNMNSSKIRNNNSSRNTNHNSIRSSCSNSSANEYSQGYYERDTQVENDYLFRRSFKHEQESGGRVYQRAPPDLPDFLMRKEEWTESCMPPYVEHPQFFEGDPSCFQQYKKHDRQAVPSPTRVVEHPQFFEGDPSSVQQYKKYDRQAVPSPTRVVEHPHFSEGDPSCVQQSNGQPMQLLTDFEQPRNHQLGISYIDLNNPQSPFGGGGPPLEHQSFVYSKEIVQEHNQDEYDENDSESNAEVESDNMVDNIYRNLLAQFNRKKYISKCDVNSGTNRQGNSCRSSHSNSSANESQGFYETDAQMENEYLNDDGYHTYPVPLSRKECASECAMHYDLSGSNEFDNLPIPSEEGNGCNDYQLPVTDH